MSDRRATIEAVDELTGHELAILLFAGRHFLFAGARESAIRDEFRMTPTRYFAALNAVIDKPAALVAEPVLVNRLRRLRDDRAARRGRRRGAA